MAGVPVTLTDDAGRVRFEGRQVGGGGSQPGVPIVRAFPFAFNSPDIQARILPITGVDQGTQTFTVAGDYTFAFVTTNQFVVAGSTGNDGTYNIVSSTFASGATSVVVVEAIPDATVDGAITTKAGFPIYTPTLNDRWLDGWVEVDTAWDGATPFCDFGQLGGNVFGLLGNNASPTNMAQADTPFQSVGPSGNNSSPTDVVAAVANSTGTVRELPGKFVSAAPVCVWVTQDGHDDGADPGSSMGTGTLVIVTVTPA